MSTNVPALSFGERLKAFYGFSRGLQATLSISQPALAAIIALGGLPGLREIVLGVIAATAGYFAVFAVNDLIDVRLDRQRFHHLRSYEGFDVDSAAVRHPLAQGYFAYWQGVLWIVVLSVIALVAAYALSPVSAALFVIAALLEVGYCAMARVTPFKFIPTGLMVAVGAVAGWFAVVPLDPARIEWALLIAFFIWMAAWEIGGRNIVNDWSDVEEDIHLGVKTVPVVFGYKVAGALVFFFLAVTFLASLALALIGLTPTATRPSLGLIFLAGCLVEGVYALIWPGIKLLRDPRPAVALQLFNRASFYPMVMLPILLISVYVSRLFGV
jgi:4-hydroxybenzoate polyprenyltransferase